MSKVSIYMSSFNHDQFLHESILSVLNQTFSDFELFIVDDASTDDSWSIVDSFKDSRIHAIRNEINRNDKEMMKKVVFEMASGEYIAVHHSDNIWEPEKLQKQVDFLETHPEIGAVFTNAQIIDEDGEPFKDKSHFYYSIFDQPNRTRHEWLNFFFYQGNALCHPSILIRKKCYEDCGFYRNGFIQLPDFEMWVRLCLKYEIHVIPEKLTHFRVQSDEMNISGNRPDSRIRGQLEYLHLLQNYLEIPTFQEMVKIFPSAQKFYRTEGSDTGFILAMIALEPHISNPVIQLFGQLLLFEAWNDPSRSQRINELYGFTRKDYRALTGKYDIFSTETKTDFFEKSNGVEQSGQALPTPLRGIAPWGKKKSGLFIRRNLSAFAPRSSNRYHIIKYIYRLITFPFRVNQERLIMQDASLIRSSGLFDETWYLENNPDVVEARIDPLKHYLLHGGFEGRQPGPHFSSRDYFANHKEIRQAGINPLVHYLKYGKSKHKSK